MYTVFYESKNTAANTEYVTISDEDKNLLIQSLMSLNFWLQEASITSDKEIKDFINWYQKPNKKYPYNSNLKKNNSPQSIVAGLINNLVFGTQRDFSLTQLELAQDINNVLIDVVGVIKEEKKIDLQSKSLYTKIWSQLNIWSNN
jgi:hypothetical protein